MALNSIISVKGPEGSRVSATVYRDSGGNEYRVKVRCAGVFLSESTDYHTDDRQDAIDTAKKMVLQHGNQQQAAAHDSIAQRLDEYLPAFDLGRSRASMHRYALAAQYQARYGVAPDHELE